MDKKMTSGEIAKKAGISQKAVRLYDEKGLLKPSDYSEGNYRLYDKEALLVLEKIIALKKIGFSLEEIHDNLIIEQNLNIRESLERQLQMMEAKKYEIEKTISCIRSVLVRTEGEPDWNSVAEIARLIQVDQKADDTHFSATKHQADTMDWYVKIYNSLGLKGDSKVLDLGCGFAKIWRNNWTDIPENVTIKAVDLHGSWADNFAEFIPANEKNLASGTKVDMLWGDVESADTWNEFDKEYDYIVAHYLLNFLSDREGFIARVSKKLAENGMFSCNGYYVSREDDFWKGFFEKIGLNSSFATDRYKDNQAKQDEFKELLSKYFKTVEIIDLGNAMRYDDTNELFERLMNRYPDRKKYFEDNAKKICDKLDEEIETNGEVIIETDAAFYHCFK